MKKKIKEYLLGDMTAIYLTDEEGRAELMLCPAGMEKKLCWGKPGSIDPMVQLSLEGDASSGGFSAGHTFRNSETARALRYTGQEMEETPWSIRIVTTLQTDNGLSVRHILKKEKNSPVLEFQNEITNGREMPVRLEMAESFSLGMLTPFENYEQAGQLLIHRIRSKWSAEGQTETRTVEELQLEPSWSRHGVAVERFGQVGTLPVRKYFPFLAVEDMVHGVVWAVQLEAGASWQMELYRRDENLCISGGMADYGFGHWAKNLETGETFRTPRAYATVFKGGFDETCQRLSGSQKKSERLREERLPVIFNEFCTTWGNPNAENIHKILDTLRGKDMDYFVIDAGWYADKELGWDQNMGDWEICEEMFPEGLGAVVEEIKSAGFKPGIWFEAEIAGGKAEAIKQSQHFLKRNGAVIRSGHRQFWDMRSAWVQSYLKEKVIDFLKKYGFEYVKIDYNESVGIGCDGAESPGQGMYESILASKAFFAKMKKETPGLVLEICSSGGHRLEPSFLEIADVASFSDAHEELEIPVIAANLHRVMRPDKSQIWSVIRETDSPDRICYSMAAAFLGVLCLSGDVLNLTKIQWKLIEDGIAFYRKLDGIIKDGITTYFGTEQKSLRHLKGWQGILREGTDERNACLVIHSFETAQRVKAALSGWRVAEVYEARPHSLWWEGDTLCMDMEEAYEAAAILLEKQED